MLPVKKEIIIYTIKYITILKIVRTGLNFYSTDQILNNTSLYSEINVMMLSTS